MARLRFFVSYARQDHEFANLLVDQLRYGKHHVWLDEMLVAGWQFTEEIQKDIQRCHFFIPVISKRSKASVWVHQETGYAIACGVAVVPAVLGEVHVKWGMIDGIQPIVVREPVDQDQLIKQLRNNRWDRILRHEQGESRAVFECNSDDTERSRLITKSAQEVTDEFKNITVMQRSTLTSFSLPKEFEDRNWESVGDRRLLFWFKPKERLALERLAKGGSCCLIIDPCYAKAGYRLDVIKAKLLTLQEFLLSNRENDRVRVVVQPFDRSESEVIIEDHWMSHSAAVGTMVTERETISTWHAPTVRRYAETYRREFETLFEQQGALRGQRTSAEYAANCINCRLNTLRNCSTVPGRCAHCDFNGLPGS